MRATQRRLDPRATARSPSSVRSRVIRLRLTVCCGLLNPTVEAVGAFEDLRTNDKGLATVSTDTGFECHIRLAEVTGATFVSKESADKTLHIVRLLNAEKKTLLSAILSAETPGEAVEEGAIEYWSKLRDRFGDEVELMHLA